MSPRILERDGQSNLGEAVNALLEELRCGRLLKACLHRPCFSENPLKAQTIYILN